MAGRDHANEFTGLVELMQYSEDVGFDGGWSIEYGRILEHLAIQRLHVLPLDEPAHPSDVANDPEVDRCAIESRARVLHDEDSLSDGRQVFAVVAMSLVTGQVYLEMRLRVADLDDAKVLVRGDAAMARGHMRKQRGGSDGAKTVSDEDSTGKEVHVPYSNATVI